MLLSRPKLDTEHDKCSLCGKPHPNPPHELKMESLLTLDMYLCPPCHGVLRRVTLRLVNGLREIRGMVPLRFPEEDWR